MGKVEAMMLDFARRAQELWFEYDAEITRAGIKKILTVENLAADPKLTRSFETIAATRKLTEQYHAKNLALVDDLPNRIVELEVDPSTQGSAFVAFDQKSPGMKEEVNTAWRFETAALDELEATVRVLKEHRGRWAVQNGKLLFDDVGCQSEYQSHLVKLVEITKQRAAYRKSLLFGTAPAEKS
jgi:hypothetical protein